MDGCIKPEHNSAANMEASFARRANSSAVGGSGTSRKFMLTAMAVAFSGHHGLDQAAEGRIAVDRSALVSDPLDIVREPLKPNEKHLYHSDSHSGNFLHCVRTRQPTICNANVAHRAASALLLGGVAKQLGRGVKWDPEAERFIGDDEANRMCSIAKRPPWRI